MTTRTPAQRAKYIGFLTIALFLMACGACSCGNPIEELLGTGGTNVPENTATDSVEFGDVVTAAAIGSGNEPQQVRSEFSLDNDPIIYVVAEVQRVDAGTTLFSRWSRDGDVFEDSPSITADEEYTDTYLEFHIEPIEGEFEPGDYTVQIYVNGNPGPSTEFTVE